MNYISTVQAAKKWDVSPRQVMNLAKAGRIPDAIQIGTRWMIPEHAEKPADGRTREVKSDRNSKPPFFRYPAFEGRDVDSFNPPLSEEELTIKKAAEAFHACRFKDAEKAISGILYAEDRYHRISALHIACMTYIFLSKTDAFFECYGKLETELLEDFPHKKEMSSLIHEIDASLGMSGYFVTEFSVDINHSYHESYLSHLASLCMVSMSSSDATHLTEQNLMPYEYITSSLEGKGNNLDSQTIHFYLGLAYGKLLKDEEMKHHYRKALGLTEKYQLYYQAAMLYYYYGSSFDQVLAEFPKEFAERIRTLSKDIHKMYLRFMESTSPNSFYSLLFSNDFIYVFCAAQGMTNKEVAKLLHISEGTVGKRYGDIYSSLGVKNKAEMVELYRKSISSSQLK